MTNISIGATYISDELLSIQDILELENDYSLYHLMCNGKNVFLIYNTSGYFEINQSYTEINNLKNVYDFKNLFKSNNLFLEEILANNETKFLCSLTTIDENLCKNEKVKENFKRYDRILQEIENSMKRGAKIWYHMLFQRCFFNYAYPEVYLTKNGFTFENGSVVFTNTTKKTIKNNLDKLKSLNLLDYKYRKDKVSDLKFNINKFSLFPDLIPSTFLTAFYENTDLEKFIPINNQLKKIGTIETIDISKRKEKIDYVEKQIDNEQIGSKSEQLAFEFEIERLEKEGVENCNQKVKIVSDDNTLGYDILSLEKHNENRYIEVKTVKRISDLYSFHITANEIEKVKKLSNYYIYIVIYTTKDGHSIKIIETANMLNSEYFKIVPTDYKVYLKY